MFLKDYNSSFFSSIESKFYKLRKILLTMKVPFVDLSEQYLFIQNEVQAVVNEVLDSKN
ncbi:hypothetical protein MHK_000644, partial [Candidatus Magnetomorum sp. HK-1]